MNLRYRFYRVHPIYEPENDRVKVELLAPERERNAIVHFCSFDQKGKTVYRRSDFYTVKTTPELSDPALRSHELALFLHRVCGDQRKMCVPAHAWIFSEKGWEERSAYVNKLANEHAIITYARKLKWKVTGSRKHMWEGAEASNAISKRYNRKSGCWPKKR